MSEAIRIAAWLAAALMPIFAGADTGVRIAAQGGAAFDADADAYLGLGLRLTAPGSPLAIQPAFDYVFDEGRTLYHVGGNALYEAPIAFRLKPFLGVGANLGVFKLDEESRTGDSEGFRLGMNLIAGARLDMPWVSPFVQATQAIGEFDALAIGGGLELSVRERDGSPAAPEPMRVAATPYLANNAFGDVQSGRLGLGLSLTAFPWERFGFELDGELHGHFFRDGDFAAEEGVDLNTVAALATASGVVRACASGPAYGTWCPYATLGAGFIHAWFDAASHAPETPSRSATQTDPALAAGIGIVHLFSRHVALRVDARYFRAFASGSADALGYSEEYGFLRLSPGLAFGF